MPAAMHACYLRNCYVENRLVAGTLGIAGKVVDLSTIKAPTPGQRSGPVRFVLGSGGHIAGIVSPPGPKAWHMVADTDDLPSTGAAWHDVATRRAGTWWEDWARWSDEHSGPLGTPPKAGGRKHPVLGDGPGGYVTT